MIIASGCTKQVEDPKMQALRKKIDQYAKTEIKYDHDLLNDNEKLVLKKLYEAAKEIDELFLEQVYSKNFEIRDLLSKSEDPMDKLTLEYFNINFGPFDRLDNNKPFWGSEEKPKGANFYPPDMTKSEFENWILNNPADEKAFTSEFTVIKRNDGKLIAIPYTVEYAGRMKKISALLKEAASYAENESLKKYLTTRADAFITNDYFESDKAWMDMKDHKIEVIIGPYEVYEDELFNYKASFECFITIIDPAETKKLEVFAGYLTDFEKNLPLPENLKNYERGEESPMIVAQEVFSAGDTKAGVQTLAFNLPNDERVRKEKGSKKVMLNNIHEAKFDKLLKPIAEKVLDAGQLKYVTFDGFFNHTLMHEISHGVGPGFITVNGKKTEVKKELKETYSKIEECKADILGMLNNMLMIEKGVYPASFEKEMWSTFLAGIFRSIRFGVSSAHGAGNAIIFNFLVEKGAYNYDINKKQVNVNFDKVFGAVKELAAKVLLIQAEGNYAEAKMLIDKYGSENDMIRSLTSKLKTLPVDIKPEFEIENMK